MCVQTNLVVTTLTPWELGTYWLSATKLYKAYAHIWRDHNCFFWIFHGSQKTKGADEGFNLNRISLTVALNEGGGSIINRGLSAAPSKATSWPEPWLHFWNCSNSVKTGFIVRSRSWWTFWEISSEILRQVMDLTAMMKLWFDFLQKCQCQVETKRIQTEPKFRRRNDKNDRERVCVSACACVCV